MGALADRLRDVLYVRFTDHFAGFPRELLAGISPASPLKRLARVAAYAGLRLVGHLFQPIRNPDELRSRVWLYAVSANNFEALSFIREARPDAVLLAGQGKNLGRYGRQVNRLSLRRKILYYYQYPAALWGLRRQVGRWALRFFDLVFYAVGYYEVYRRALRHYQPRAVVFANDHNDDSRSLLLACRAEGVPTAYVQHASVSTNFPPLGFDLSLLEGQDALDKYRLCGPVTGQVELVGMPKADAFLAERNLAPAVRRVAVACNLLDELPAVQAALAVLLHELPGLAFTLRPHPGDRRDFAGLRAALPGLAWSDPHQENVFEFLRQHDALVAADTSTHLEAVLLNVASVYYRFSPTAALADYYGYAAHGLSEWARSGPELVAALARLAHHKPADLYRRAAYYNATLGTPDEGHSGALALRQLDGWLRVQQGLGLVREIEAATGCPVRTSPDVPPAEQRLAYVQRHLALAYPGAPVELLGYADAPGRVVLPALGDEFFEQETPYPAAPGWREWEGRRLPFFFDQPDCPLLTLTDGRATLGADLVAAAFYLLSGWQECFSAERDRYGRFPYAASVQARHGFVAVPVVNYYFEVLKTALEHLTGQQYPPRRWGPQRAPFAAFVSHDVDNLRSAWKAPAKAALRQGRLLAFGRQLWQHLTRPDAWDNLEAVAAQVAQYGGRSTFFVLPTRRKASDGTPNADYRLTPRLWQRLGRLKAQGCELALHGSLGSSTSAPQLLGEESDADALGLRFHYLSWHPARTPAVVEQARFLYDSTLGFAEHYGFRHGYCLPFYPFDFEAGRAADFLEIPLNVMDATLHHLRYLQLAPDELLPALTPVFEEIRRFGGVASVLWHNENFDPANVRNGPREFHTLMGCLQRQGAAFLTGAQVYDEFTAPPGSYR